MDNIIVPNTLIYKQQEKDTCGSASARMILQSLYVYVDEYTIKQEAYRISGRQSSGYRIVHALTGAINLFLQQEGITTRYSYEYVGNYTNEEFAVTLALLTYNRRPVQVQFRSQNETTYLPYTTTGHYAVVNGVKEDVCSSSTSLYALLYDPFCVYYTDGSYNYEHAGLWELPTDKVFQYVKNHSGYIIYCSTM